MSKGSWIGGFIAVIGLGCGYAAGVYLTAEHVNAQYQRYVVALTQSYRGVATVTSAVDASFFSSANKLSLEFNNLPQPVLELTQTNTFNFDINFSHNFLSSQSVLTIAEGELLDIIKSYQVNVDKLPLVLSNEYSYDLFSQEVLVQGEFATDALKYRSADIALHVGSTNGPFTMTQSAFQFDLQVKTSHLAIAGVEFKLGALTFEQNATSLNGDILSAGLTQHAKANIKVLEFDVVGVQGKLELDELMLAVEQQVKDQRVVLDAQYTIKSLGISSADDEFQIDNGVLDFNLDVDLAAGVAFVEGIKELQRSGAVNNPAALFTLLNGLTQQGVNVNVERLAVSLAGDSVEGDARLKMAPFSIEEMMLDRQAALNKIDLEAGLVLPKKLLAALPDYNPGQLDFLVGMGFLLDKGDDYRFSMKIKQGQITLNGQRMPNM